MPGGTRAEAPVRGGGRSLGRPPPRKCSAPAVEAGAPEGARRRTGDAGSIRRRKGDVNMIKGITDRTRTTRLGKIRLGEKKRTDSGKSYPAKLDHFNFVDAPAVAKVYGDACVTLAPVLLPSNNIDVFWKTSKSAY